MSFFVLFLVRFLWLIIHFCTIFFLQEKLPILPVIDVRKNTLHNEVVDKKRKGQDVLQPLLRGELQHSTVHTRKLAGTKTQTDSKTQQELHALEVLGEQGEIERRVPAKPRVHQR